MQHKKPNIIRLITSIFVIVVTTMSLSATSTPLISGSVFIDLPSPGKTGAPITVNPIFTDLTNSFTGEWDTTAALDWQGKIIGTGPRILTTPNKTGTENMNFSGLTNGYLPKNSFFGLFDLDRGSQSGEIISLRAWDASGVILLPWLDVPTFQDGTPLNHTADMLPDFNWNPLTGIYTFDGNGETWSGNPSISVWMQNNQEILELEVIDQTPFASFALSAPPPSIAVPVPATILLFGAGLMALGGLRMNKNMFRKERISIVKYTRLIFAILAILLGFVSSAYADTCPNGKPDFAKEITRNAEWNTHVASSLNSSSSLAQLKSSFETSQCAVEWQLGYYVGVTNRSCKVYSVPTPSFSGTTINYAATSSSPAVIKLAGCGTPLRAKRPPKTIKPQMHGPVSG